jgi:hypothetical protein
MASDKPEGFNLIPCHEFSNSGLSPLRRHTMPRREVCRIEARFKHRILIFGQVAQYIAVQDTITGEQIIDHSVWLPAK